MTEPDGSVPSPAEASGRIVLVVGVALMVVGSVLLPAGIVLREVRTQVSDTDVFVATLAPLAGDPQVQAAVAEIAADTIMDQIASIGLVDRLAQELSMSDRAELTQRGAEVLRAAAQSRLDAQVRTAVLALVQSRQFAALWEQSLRLTHSQLVAALDDERSGVIATEASGRLEIQVGPLLGGLGARLSGVGLTTVDGLRLSDARIVLLQSPAVAALHRGYNVVMSVGVGLDWLAVVLLVVSVVVLSVRSRRPPGASRIARLLGPTAAVAATAALAVAVTLLVVHSGRGLVVGSVGEPAITSVLAGGAYDAFSAVFSRSLLVALALTGGLAVAAAAIRASTRHRGFSEPLTPASSLGGGLSPVPRCPPSVRSIEDDLCD